MKRVMKAYALAGVTIGLSIPLVSIQTDARASQRGIASWYGPGFAGRRTASGEVFNPHALTAAHRSLPFGTRVQVTSERTGRSVVVRINDRGPFGGGRIIDLSSGSAHALGMGGAAPVSLVPLGRKVAP